MKITGDFAAAVVTMMDHVKQAHGYEQIHFKGGKFTVGLVVRWNRDDSLMWEVLSENYPKDKNTQKIVEGRRSIQRVNYTSNQRQKVIDQYLDSVKDTGMRKAIRKAISSDKTPENIKGKNLEILQNLRKMSSVEDEFFRWTSAGPDNPEGGHAEELMLRNWAETYLPYNGNEQPKLVEIVISRSPCYDESSSFIYNEHWPQGCAPKLCLAMDLLESEGTEWALGFFELATPEDKSQLALQTLRQKGMGIYRVTGVD